MTAAIPQWAIDIACGLVIATVILILIHHALKSLGAELSHFIHAIRSEIKDASFMRSTVGSWNAYGLMSVSAVGCVVMIAASGQKVLGLMLVRVIGQAKADELAKYSDFSSFFFCILVFALVSLICVTIDSRRDRD